MASNDDKVEELLNNGVCACFPMYGQRSGCPFCRTKRAREEAKFNELIGKNLNLEMKGKYLLSISHGLKETNGI
ncbi:hypothetical protein QL285_085088 [Trifolium repens]|nr:hypothetical protein QL285_085088 [Trifolium repens]